MKLVPRFLRREEPPETKCPRCGVPAPMNVVECSACGWDLRDAYHEPAGVGSMQSDRGDAGR